MALILAVRATLPVELGDLLVDCDVFRPHIKNGTDRIRLHLQQINEAQYEVVDGCASGVDLFSPGNRVAWFPVDRPGYIAGLAAVD